MKLNDDEVAADIANIEGALENPEFEALLEKGVYEEEEAEDVNVSREVVL